MSNKEEGSKYKCEVCGYVYDPAEGDPDRGIDPGTPFEDLPEDWVCPLCGVGKDEFKREGLNDLFIARDLEQIIESEQW